MYPSSNTRSARRNQSTAAKFLAPLAIALLSIVGLISALTGDGVRDFVSWGALSVPVAVVAWALHARRR